MAGIHTIRLNIGDFIADTYTLDTTELGAYMRLLLVHYKVGEKGLPDDDKELARMAGVSTKVWKRISPKVRQYFTWKDNFGRQKRVLLELDRVTKCRDSALKRHNSDEKTQAERTCETPARHKTEDIRHKTLCITPLTPHTGFTPSEVMVFIQRVKEVWPKEWLHRFDKSDATPIIMANGLHERTEEIVEAVRAFCECEDWKDGMVPKLSKFLGNDLWENPPAKKQTTNGMEWYDRLYQETGE